MKVKVKWCESLVQHKGAENAPPSSKPLQSADAVLAVGGISRGSSREGKVRREKKFEDGKGSKLQKRPGRTLQVRNAQQATCNTWKMSLV